MAERLAAWLLMDGDQTAAGVCQRELIGTSVAALPASSRAHHLHVAATALGEVLV
jgi:hypothetical protein